MPYETSDELVYTNQDNDTLRFTINQKEISEPYETHKGRNACNSNFDIASIGETGSLSFSYTVFNDYTTVAVSVNSCFNNIKTNNLNSETEQIYIENSHYSQGLIFEKDTITNDDEIWKIILAKNYGIIQFHDRETEAVWTLRHEQSR